MNLVILTGNLGKDPELTYTQSGKNVMKFSIATTDGYGENKKTNWHRVEIWNKEQLLPYISKGSKITVTGSIDYTEYEGKYYTTIKAYNIELLGSKKGEDNAENI